MATLLLGLVVVGLSIVASYFGLKIVRRFVPVSVLKSHQEVAASIMGVLGAVYAVLLAFMVVALWNQYTEAQATVEREANRLNDLAHLARGFAERATQQKITAAIVAYGESVVRDEWPAMRRGQASSQAQAALDQLWQSFLEINAPSGRETQLYSESLVVLREITDSRRLRLFASRNDLPLVFQVLLWGGGLITIAFTYFFGAQSVRAQSLMTSALTGIIAFNLFLILVLDNPFHGYVRIAPEPLQEILARIQL